MQPLLSIIIPTYNRVEYLRRSIFSIFGQGVDADLYRKIEVIVSNNASTDYTYNFLESIKGINSALKVFHNSENLQIYGNMVEPIKNACGKYIMYLTDDDYLLPGGLCEIISFLENSNYDFVRLNFITYLEQDINAFVYMKKIKKILTHKTENPAQIANVFVSTHVLSGNIIKRSKINFNKLQENLHDDIKRWFCYVTPIFELSTNFAFIPHAYIMHTWQNELNWDGEEEQPVRNKYSVTADGFLQILKDSSISHEILCKMFYQIDPNTKLYPYTKKYLSHKTRILLYIKRLIFTFLHAIKRRLF